MWRIGPNIILEGLQWKFRGLVPYRSRSYICQHYSWGQVEVCSQLLRHILVLGWAFFCVLLINMSPMLTSYGLYFRLLVSYISTIMSIITSHMSFGQNVVWICFNYSSQVDQFCCLSCWSKQTRLERTGRWTDEEFRSVCGFQRGCSYRIGRCYIIRSKTFLNYGLCFYGNWLVFKMSWYWWCAALKLFRASDVVLMLSAN